MELPYQKKLEQTCVVWQSLLKKKNSTRLCQHRESTGEFGRSAQVNN